MKESIEALICSVLIPAALLVVSMLSPAMTERLDLRALFEMDAIELTGVATSSQEVRGMPISESTVVFTEMPTATVNSTTWTTTVADTATTTATSTMTLPASPSSPSPLLDRLADDKPSIWGSKGFYIVLGLVYVALLGWFLKQVISTLRHEQP